MSDPKKCSGVRGGKPCENPILFGRGFCATCYKNFVQDCKNNGSWRPYDQTLHQKVVDGLKVERKTWLEEGGWVGSEDELEEQETKNHGK